MGDAADRSCKGEEQYFLLVRETVIGDVDLPRGDWQAEPDKRLFSADFFASMNVPDGRETMTFAREISDLAGRNAQVLAAGSGG